MKEILVNLQKVLRESSFLDFFNDKSIIVDDIEFRIEKMSVKDFPIILLSRAGERVATGRQDRIVQRKTVEILVAQQYNKVDTVILGDHLIKGITEISDLIIDAISENPTLNDICRGFDPETINIEEGFLLGNSSSYLAGRKIYFDFFKLKSINSG